VGVSAIPNARHRGSAKARLAVALGGVALEALIAQSYKKGGDRDAESYAAVLAHELTHSTKHSKRLARDR
jgi:hypothetical protein